MDVIIKKRKVKLPPTLDLMGKWNIKNNDHIFVDGCHIKTPSKLYHGYQVCKEDIGITWKVANETGENIDQVKVLRGYGKIKQVLDDISSEYQIGHKIFETFIDLQYMDLKNRCIYSIEIPEKRYLRLSKNLRVLQNHMIEVGIECLIVDSKSLSQDKNQSTVV
ncbi:hypothetical protein [Bulleidia extructa]